MSHATNGTQHPNMVVGVFSTLRGAERVVRQLETLGLSPSEITVISSSDVVKRYFEAYRPDAEPDDWKEAAVAGGSTGAVLAGLTSVAALVTGAGIPVVVAGGLASFITGGIVGGLAGAMTERGFETEAADYYELAVADGKTLVAIDLTDRADMQSKRLQIDNTLAEAGAEPVELHKNPDFSSK
jgi:outer membrane lipoprotein SlyB